MVDRIVRSMDINPLMDTYDGFLSLQMVVLCTPKYFATSSGVCPEFNMVSILILSLCVKCFPMSNSSLSSIPP